MMIDNTRIEHALELLEAHYEAFQGIVDIARETGHPVPVDTRAWSQILVSVLTGIPGIERKKGSDLKDGSDVKGAITWEAIDTPRFNGVIKAGTRSATSGKLTSLDSVPFIFLVLWDNAPESGDFRCRVWCVRPQQDIIFRKMCASWYQDREVGRIRSNNFQLHPPRNQNSNIMRNSYGNLEYPLLFHAERMSSTYVALAYSPDVLVNGICREIQRPNSG